MSALILPKLGLCRDRQEAINKLESMNARPIGRGHFASVYEVFIDADMPYGIRPEWLEYDAVTDRVITNFEWKMRRERRIVKVSRADRGGLTAAKAAMLTHEYDPLAPVYYGIVEFGNGDWMGELEPLTTVNDWTTNIRTCGHGKETSHLTGGSREPLASVMEVSPYLQIIAKMRDASMTDGRMQLRWDLHGENVMMRGNQPVVTDPLA